MDKFSSKVHRVHMELGGKLLNFLRIETQFLERLQSVSVFFFFGVVLQLRPPAGT